MVAGNGEDSADEGVDPCGLGGLLDIRDQLESGGLSADRGRLAAESSQVMDNCVGGAEGSTNPLRMAETLV